MNVEQLLALNKDLKRRLFVKSPGVLLDALENQVSAEFCGVDKISVVELDRLRISDPTRPYRVSLPLAGITTFSEDEAKLVLGYDYFTAPRNDEDTYLDIQAMLETSQGGMLGANAYFLGPTIKRVKEISEIPIAYFKIPSKAHKKLAIKTKEDKFKFVIARLNKAQP